MAFVTILDEDKTITEREAIAAYLIRNGISSQDFFRGCIRSDWMSGSPVLVINAIPD